MFWSESKKKSKEQKLKEEKSYWEIGIHFLIA